MSTLVDRQKDLLKEGKPVFPTRKRLSILFPCFNGTEPLRAGERALGPHRGQNVLIARHCILRRLKKRSSDVRRAGEGLGMKPPTLLARLAAVILVTSLELSITVRS